VAEGWARKATNRSMNNRDKLKDLLKKPGVMAQPLEITPEVKARCFKVAKEITDLVLTLDSPLEAIFILHVVSEQIANASGLHLEGVTVLTDEDMEGEGDA
jgi:hypothetical protein